MNTGSQVCAYSQVKTHILILYYYYSIHLSTLWATLSGDLCKIVRNK